MRYFKYVISLLISLGCVLNGQLVWGQTTPQNYPNKTVKIIVPFAPGGGNDLVARLVTEPLGEILKQPVIVVNKTGAGGSIGTSYVAKAAPDGYTISIGTTSTHAVAPAAYSKLGYNLLVLRHVYPL